MSLYDSRLSLVDSTLVVHILEISHPPKRGSISSCQLEKKIQKGKAKRENCDKKERKGKNTEVMRCKRIHMYI
jgi:hypothetical protein